MFCSKCGKQIDDNSKFCQFCGETVAGDSSVQPTNAEYQQQQYNASNNKWFYWDPIDQEFKASRNNKWFKWVIIIVAVEFFILFILMICM